MDKKKQDISKEALVAEYLIGTISYRGLESKYGIPSRTICGWVLEYQGRVPSSKERKRVKKEKENNPNVQKPSNEVKNLQQALRRSQLKNELLEEMLNLSEEHTGVDLRKKFGAKQ